MCAFKKKMSQETSEMLRKSSTLKLQFKQTSLAAWGEGRVRDKATLLNTAKGVDLDHCYFRNIKMYYLSFKI